MQKEKRILALSSSAEQLDTLIDKAAEIAERYGAGVTLLYVKEERLFDLPLFAESEGSLEDLVRILRERLRERGLEGWAVFAYENDLVDHARLEAEREHSFLVLSDDHEELDDLVGALKRPLLCLKRGASHRYKNLLIALDSASSSEEGIDFVLEFAGEARPRCLMDYQMLITLSDPAVDPVVGAMIPDLLMEEENEVIQARKRSFEELCRRRGIEGEFLVGEQGLVEDLLEAVKGTQSDLLAIVAEDPDTLLAEAAKIVVRKSPCDLLLCYNRRSG